jgi:GTPase SAR1 family protein
MTSFFCSPDSLENVETLWAKEVKHFCKNSPILLVGNKSDLRHDERTIQGTKWNRNKFFNYF